MENESNVRGYQFDDITFRSYAVSPSTWNDEDRGFDAVLATEAPVLVMDMRARRVVREVLRMEGVVLPASNRLPLQDSHQRGSVRNTLGSALNLRVVNKQFVARNVISSVESAVATKVKEGHITDNSIGYVVLDREVIEPGTEREVLGVTYRADAEIPLQVSTRWRPIENSLTPVGADEAAKFRSAMWFTSEEKAMADEKKVEVVAAPPQDTKPETKTEEVKTETIVIEEKPQAARRDLLAEITPRGYEAILEESIVKGLDVEAHRAVLLVEVAKKRAPVGTPEPKVEDEKKDGLKNVSDAAFVRMF
jgi:hypothetical protein